MQIQYTGQNIEITSAIRELTEKKINKQLKSHLDKITHIHVTFKVDHLTQIAEATLNIPKKTIHASAQSDDMYKTIDELMHKLNTQLIKHKEKQEDRR